MTTRQSTTLHMSGDGEDPNNGLAFSTIDAGDPEAGAPGEIRQVLEVWGTIEAPDGQILTARMKVGMPDVRDLQAFLNDNYARGQRGAEAGQTFPYESGGFLVIGPDCFTNNDASVLSYHGANYVRQAANDDSNAQYFRDGWMASLRELLETSQVRGYEAAIEWTKGQLGASAPVEYEPTTGGALLGEEEYPVDAGGHVYDVPNDPWQPKPGDTVNVFPMTATMPDGEQKPGFVITPRQCAVIYNGIQCLAPEGHAQQHDFGPIAQHQPDVDLFQEQAAAIQRADASTPTDNFDNTLAPVYVDLTPNLVPGPKNAAEQERKRRLKVEIAFDEAAAAYRLDPQNNGAVNDLAKAVAELRKREPGNSRIANWDTTQAVAAVIDNGLQTPQQEQLPEAHFAPEPAVSVGHHPQGGFFASADGKVARGDTQDAATQALVAQAYQPIPYNGGDPSLHAAEKQFEQASAQAQQAAQAFPCPHAASDGRPCQRPVGHEIELPNRPAVPHVYATNPATLTQQPVAVTPGPNGPHVTYQPPAQPQPDAGFVQTPPPNVAPAQPFQQPHLQAVPDQTNVAVMSFHEGEPGMPAAPAMPTWQAPQQ